MSGPHEGLPRTVFKGQFEPASFALVLSRKDTVLATELGRECDVPMPVANLAEQIVIEAMNRGARAIWIAASPFGCRKRPPGSRCARPAVDPGKAATIVSTHSEGDG